MPASITPSNVRRTGVYPDVSKRRFNIWLDNELIETVTSTAKLLGVKASTYMRMAILEKLNRRPKDGQPNTEDVSDVQAIEATR